MRKWLIILALIIVAVLAVLWWLGNSANAHKPEAGETRMEIEHVL
jgi:flagellar basal body-associated protein FliL